MMAGEVMHLLAAKWHPLCSQSGLETWRGREEMPASVALGLGDRLSHSATTMTWFPTSISSSKWCSWGGRSW